MVTQIEGRGVTHNVSREEHEAKRREVKERQRHSLNKGKFKAGGNSRRTDGDNLFDDLKSDKVEKFGLRLMDELLEKMTSSSLVAKAELGQALLDYITEFIDRPKQFKRWQERHADALEKALSGMSGDDPQCVNYARRTINQAFRKVLRAELHS